MKRQYDVAAYIWPAYTGDEPRTRMFWQEGIGNYYIRSGQIYQRSGEVVEGADPYQ